MYNILLIIQYVNIIALFTECVIVFRNWKNYLHGWLFLCNVVQLVNAVGILVEYTSHTVGAYVNALRISYLGRVWVALFMFFFVLKLCGKKIPKLAALALVTIHAGIFVSVFTIPDCKLYYTKYVFYLQGGFAHFAHSNGIAHHLYTGLQILYIVAGIVLLIVTFFREQTPVAKKRIKMVFYAVVAMTLFYVVQITDIFPGISHVFDLTIIGYTLCTTFMYIAIIRFDLLGAEQLAKEYIVDKLSEGIIAVDYTGKTAYFNKPAEALFPDLSKRSSEIVGLMDTAIEKNEPMILSERVYTPRMETLYRGSDVLGSIYVLHDNTELYKHAEELEEMTARANSANRAKSLFLSSMSHEIRTPINAVLGMDEMILRESRDREITGYAEDIRTAGRTLLSIINDILDFSKIEEGRMEILPAQYELSSLINDLVNMVRTRAEKKGLSLDINVDGNIPHLLCGDEIRIKQCALNILTNAVKYTEKGTVTFTLGFEKTDSTHILLKFLIKDTGIGMKPEDMEKLFSPFSRIEEKRNRSIEGTGLGMSITKQLLALMNSELKVSSVYGEGSEFSFDVVQEVVHSEPIGDYTARYRSENEHTAYREMFRAPDAKILVIDDTAVNLSVIRGLLKQTRICVDTAGSGKEALGMAEITQYDMVFVDHMMPEMDGIETLHRLRELTGYKDTVCVALTANAVSGAREMYMEAGFSDYLSKPVDGEKLEKMLLDYLPKEKVITDFDDDAGDAGESADTGEALPEKLYEIGEIDTQSGLKHCGTPEVYLETLSIYAGTAKDNADSIAEMLMCGDVAGATIKIHALKSTSRAIGAEDLGALAEKLEFAGKAGDTAVLDAEAGGLIARYRELGNALSGLFAKSEDDEDKPLITDEMLKKSYEAIRGFSESFDIDGAALAIEAIGKYRLPESEKEKYRKLKEAADDFDWDAVAEIAGGK